MDKVKKKTQPLINNTYGLDQKETNIQKWRKQTHWI